MLPDGWHTITPRLVVTDPQTYVTFLQRAFGATGDFQEDHPSQLRIGDSLVMISGTGPRAATVCHLHLYLDDTDAAYAQAIAAGATSLEPPRDEPWGDRRALVRDPFGNDWSIATYRSR